MKPPVKKAVPKTAPAKKAAVKKVETKKVPARKVETKKAAAKKPVPKKAAMKKLAAVPPAAPPSSAVSASVLDRLHAVILQRRGADPAHSHSARLLSRGMGKVAQKLGEEAVECVIEAVAGNADALVAESADVLYHLLVVWVAAGVSPESVWAELTRREGVSGITEKLSRSGPLGTTKIP